MGRISSGAQVNYLTCFTLIPMTNKKICLFLYNVKIYIFIYVIIKMNI